MNELKIALGNRYQNKQISVVDFTASWGFFIQAKNSFSGSILADLSLKRPKLQDVNTPDGYIHFISEENIEMLDGDILFVLDFQDSDRKLLKHF